MPFSTRAFKVGDSPNLITWWTEVSANFDYLKGVAASTSGAIQLENDLAIKSTDGGTIGRFGLRLNSTTSTAMIAVSRTAGVGGDIASLTLDGYMSTNGAASTISERTLQTYDKMGLDFGVVSLSTDGVTASEGIHRILFKKCASTDEDVFGATTFSGTTADSDDLVFLTSAFSSPAHAPFIRVTVSTATATVNPVEGSTITATLQTFDWDYRDAGGNLIAAGATGIQMQTATSLASTLANGISVRFGSAINHTTGTYWQAQMNAIEAEKIFFQNLTAHGGTTATTAGVMKVGSSGLVIFSSDATFAVTTVDTTPTGNFSQWGGFGWQAPVYASTLGLSAALGTTGVLPNSNGRITLLSTGTYALHMAGRVQIDSSGDYDLTLELVRENATTTGPFTSLHTRAFGQTNAGGVFVADFPVAMNYLYTHTATAASDYITLAASAAIRNNVTSNTPEIVFDLAAERLV